MAKKVASRKSRQIHQQAQISKRKKFVPVVGKMKVVVTIGIALCVFVVLADLLATKYFAPDVVAKTKLEEIAADYYENYYYDKVVAAVPEGKTLEESMASFAETGFAQVYLRHLLLFDNGRNESEAGYFETSTYACDKNETAVRFTPVSPFGRKDYKISYSLACNYK